jgi:hypothetical protein
MFPHSYLSEHDSPFLTDPYRNDSLVKLFSNTQRSVKTIPSGLRVRTFSAPFLSNLMGNRFLFVLVDVVFVESNSARKFYSLANQPTEASVCRGGGESRRGGIIVYF